MKIAYIGIDLLSATLDALLSLNCEIMEIYTCRTDNKTEFNTYIRAVAERLSVPCYIRPICRDDMERLMQQGCEVIFCAGYYHKIPIISNIPMINIHPAYLPVGRGAWPMPAVILKGCTESGVTVHKMTNELDRGDILLQDIFLIEKDENLESLMEKVNHSIHYLIPKLLENFDEYNRNAQLQGTGEYWANYEEKDWTIFPDMSDEVIDRILRAFYGYECIWIENEKKWELIYGKLVKERPLCGKYFTTKQGSFVIAEKLEELLLCVCPTGHDALLYNVGSPELVHRDRVEGIRRRYGHAFSSHAFASLYLWRSVMQLTLYLGEELFTLRCGWKGRNAWFFPCGSKTAILDFLNSHVDEQDFNLCYLREQDVGLLREYFPEEFAISRAKASDEYIYEIEGHRNLKGKLYANARTQLHKAEREHELRTERITKDNISFVEEIIKEWEKSEHVTGFKTKLHMCTTESAFFTGTGVEELSALNNRDTLEITGILVYVDGEPYAVAAGYPLTEDTYDLFLAKEKGRECGIGYFVKRTFFLNLPKQYRYINMEEDLGMEGLHKMKKVLAPVHMNEVWEATRCKK